MTAELAKCISKVQLLMHFAVILAMAAGIIAASYPATAVPEIAAEFYGTIITNSSSASVTTNVSAYDLETGIMCGSFIVRNTGYYGLLSCDGDDTETNSTEGPKKGSRIIFRVNNTNAKAYGNTSWYPGIFKNISITSPNHEPVLQFIGSRTATAGTLFTLDADATDEDNDTLYYAINTTAFSINRDTGVINFTPIASQIGNYSLNISASDGFLEDYEVILLTINPSPFCGDKVCFNENCFTCPTDCGACPPGAQGSGAQASTQTGAGIGGGGGGAALTSTKENKKSASKSTGQKTEQKTEKTQAYACQERWVCIDWSKCEAGYQTRICTDQNNCNTNKNKPDEKKQCSILPTCSDGIKNGDEEDVDCGGPCEPCKVKKYAEAPPIPQIGKLIEVGRKIAKQIPYMFAAVIGAISLMTVFADRIYVRRITKKEFEQYRKSLKKYKAFKRHAYKFLINLISLSAIATLYIYYFSDCMKCMISKAYIPAALMAATPVAVTFLINKYQYSEYAKAKNEARIFLTHEMQLRKLIRLENQALLEIEEEAFAEIEALLRDATMPEKAKEELKPLHDSINETKELHKGKAILEIPEEILVKARRLSKESAITNLAKSYIEFDFTVKSLIKLQQKHKTAESYFYAHGDAKDSIEKVAADDFLLDMIKSDKEAIRAYNDLVEVYRHCKKTIQAFSKEEELEINFEKQIILLIEKFFVSKPILPLLQTKNELIRVYNYLIDIYDHYKKKQGIYEAVRLEKTGTS